MRPFPLKNTIVLILIILCIIACNSPAKISGKLEDTEKNDTKIYLIEPGSLKEVAASFFGKVLDSAVINSDGSFEFHNLPESEETVLLELAIKQPGKSPKYLQTGDPSKANYMPVIWQSGVPLKITAKTDEFQKSFSIEQPSEINKALLDLRDMKQKAYQAYLAGKQWQIEDGSQLLEKEHAILQYQKKLINFADSTQYLMPAMLALRWVSPEKDYERVPEFLVSQCNKWKEKQPGHPWVEQLCKVSEPSNLPVLVGDVFPNLRLPMITKDTISLKEQLGDKLTIIDLWASWCAPCRKENRNILAPIWEEYHEKGLQIIGYGLESDESAWRAAVERDGANRWLQASDLQGDDAPFLKKIRVRTIPANFILDDRGIVIAKNVHGRDLIDLVENYIQRKQPRKSQ
ncbi:thiol-disulfide isomerase/thioredoxin [Christiangramia gaetbulicola]|uniref:Thiol-disulfide isomerase/thioredoxin n=1 Tax=Christiangramia gaetbulicola TaxID=703340 RepID=A0A2T6AI81_9FLAO|nr:TlpA disulfide reductase family protein [Christiangramia gaetbulicola]PTX43497.1 thiol-disulfide isomerase/thioredoxin [Christiangramia gaetbulicola]